MAGDVNELGTSVKMVSVPKSSSSSPLLSLKTAASDKRGGRAGAGAAAGGLGLGPRLRPRGLPATTVVFDEKDGRAKAVVNARELTALRTAMGSLLATELVMMEEVKIPTSIEEEEEVVVDNGVPDDAPLNTKRKPPVTLVLFGCGLQIEYHARMLLLRFRSIRRCILLNRTRNQRAKRLQKRLWSFVRNARAPNEPATISLYTRINEEEEEEEEEEGEERKQKEEVEQQREESTFERYVRQADILCFATSATEPLLEDSWVKPGAHLILVGSYTPQMQEVPSETIQRASKVIVDSRAHAMAEAGELIMAKLDENRDLIELGELFSYDNEAKIQPLPSALASARAGQVTIFKSVGLAVQDVMIARLVYDHAVDASIGTLIDRYDEEDEEEEEDVDIDVDVDAHAHAHVVDSDSGDATAITH
ncbi:hypothetical protein FRB91_005904 [Serendipita sp. 411]|nr:hypothetical protein FRB91_005904 [Serendipita sp. 411]